MAFEPYAFVPAAHAREIRLSRAGHVSIADAVVVGHRWSDDVDLAIRHLDHSDYFLSPAMPSIWREYPSQTTDP